MCQKVGAEGPVGGQHVKNLKNRPYEGGHVSKRGGLYVKTGAPRALRGSHLSKFERKNTLPPPPYVLYDQSFTSLFFYIKQCDFHQHFLFFDVLSKKTSSPSKMTLKFESVRFFAIDIVFF